MKKAGLTKTEQRFLWTAALVCAVCVALAFGFAVPRQTGPGRAAGSETPLIQLARVDLNTAGQDALCTLPHCPQTEDQLYQVFRRYMPP